MPDQYDVYRAAAQAALSARDYASAEEHLLASLELAESGFDEARLTATLENLAEVLWYQGKYALAAPLLRRLLRKYVSRLGPDHFDVAIVANNMAMLYHTWGKNAEAEPFYKQALAIKERVLGKNHPETKLILGNYCNLLVLLDRQHEAQMLDPHEHSSHREAGASRQVGGAAGSDGSIEGAHVAQNVKTSHWRRSKLSSENLPSLEL